MAISARQKKNRTTVNQRLASSKSQQNGFGGKKRAEIPLNFPQMYHNLFALSFVSTSLTKYHCRISFHAFHFFYESVASQGVLRIVVFEEGKNTVVKMSENT